MPRHFYAMFFSLPLRRWPGFNLEPHCAISENWPTYFAITVWMLWKWRNKRTFEDPNFTPYRPYELIRKHGKENVNAFVSVPKRKLKPKSEIVVRWEPPLDNWTKLNVDGASRGNPGLAGGGGVIRGHRGNWINGFAANSGICSSVKAKILALLQGLCLAWSLGISKLEVHLDSKVVLDIMTRPTKNNQLHYFTVKKCQELICKSGWLVKLNHCNRESNRVADFLANLAVDQTNMFVFLRPLILY